MKESPGPRRNRLSHEGLGMSRPSRGLEASRQSSRACGRGSWTCAQSPGEELHLGLCVVARQLQPQSNRLPPVAVPRTAHRDGVAAGSPLETTTHPHPSPAVTRTTCWH